MGTSTSVDALQGSGFSGRHGGRKHHHLLRVFLFALVRSFAPEPVPSSVEQPIRAAEAPAACLAVCYTETESRTIGSHCRCSHQQFRRKGIVTRGRVCNRGREAGAFPVTADTYGGVIILWSVHVPSCLRPSGGHIQNEPPVPEEPKS